MSTLRWYRLRILSLKDKIPSLPPGFSVPLLVALRAVWPKRAKTAPWELSAILAMWSSHSTFIGFLRRKVALEPSSVALMLMEIPFRFVPVPMRERSPSIPMALLGFPWLPVPLTQPSPSTEALRASTPPSAAPQPPPALLSPAPT